MAEIGICDFCGEERIVEGTTVTGCYCKECHKIVIEESRDAVVSIKNFASKPISSAEIKKNRFARGKSYQRK